MYLAQYKYILFDSDGVLVNTNEIKSNAFYHVGNYFNEQYAMALMKYHKANGGISRFKKIQWLLGKLPNHLITSDLEDTLHARFRSYLDQHLLKVKPSNAIFKISKKYNSSRLFVVSGTEQKDLVSFYKKIGLFEVFDNQIYGSPDSKYDIFKSLIDCKLIQPTESVYIGDSYYDYQSSRSFGIDFIFLKDWSEYSEPYAFDKKVVVLDSLNDLL